MREIKNTQKIVERVLREHPDARNSDHVLYARVCAELGDDYKDISIVFAFMNRKALKLPNFETVGRCRRKLQNIYPELSSDAEVEYARSVKEETFKEYAKT